MWLTFLVLFAALSPGVLFTIPALGKKMGGKAVVAAMHAVLFVTIVYVLSITEGFQLGKGKVPRPIIVNTPEQTLVIAERSLNDVTRILNEYKKQLAAATAAIESDNAKVNELKGRLEQAREANVTAQNRLTVKNQELSNTQKEVLDTTAKVNILTNQVFLAASSTQSRTVEFNRKKQIENLNKFINMRNIEIIKLQEAVNAAKLAVNASNNVQRVEQGSAISGVNSNSGSRVQDIADIQAVATATHVAAEASVKAAAPQAGAVQAVAPTPAGTIFGIPLVTTPIVTTPTAATSTGMGSSATPMGTVMAAMGIPNITPMTMSGLPQEITMIGDDNAPVQPLPPGFCKRAGEYALMYNGRNDGTGPNEYRTMCTPCSMVYRSNSAIPRNIDKQSALNYNQACNI